MASMTLTIRINLDNAAFEDARDQELEAIFTRIRARLTFAGEGHAVGMTAVNDSNGNTVGTWQIK